MTNDPGADEFTIAADPSGLTLRMGRFHGIPPLLGSRPQECPDRTACAALDSRRCRQERILSEAILPLTGIVAGPNWPGQHLPGFRAIGCRSRGHQLLCRLRESTRLDPRSRRLLPEIPQQ